MVAAHTEYAFCNNHYATTGFLYQFGSARQLLIAIGYIVVLV